MAVKKGRSQARRNTGSSGGLPGWAWMILGVVLTVIVVMAAPRLLKSDREDGFYRPRANPDALPAPASDPGEDSLPASVAEDAPGPAGDSAPEYDFYTLLPGQEVPMTDAELAASASAERARERQAAEQRTQDAAQLADAPGAPATEPAAPPAAPAAAPDPAAATAAVDTAARYLLQAGAFSASGDAEALKARIALLGLGARVESAQIEGRTVYRVRMGPYGTASELSEAKRRLENGGLDALAIRVQ